MTHIEGGANTKPHINRAPDGKPHFDRWANGSAVTLTPYKLGPAGADGAPGGSITGGVDGDVVVRYGSGVAVGGGPPVLDGDYAVDMRKKAGATDAAKLQAAIDAVVTAGGGTVLIPAGVALGGTGITVPQGVWFRTHGKTGSEITYSGTSGAAFTFTGTATTDYRIGGGFLDPIRISCSGTGGAGIDLVDTRGIIIPDLSFLGNAGSGTTRKAAYGVRIRCTTSGPGASWNTVMVRGDYCSDAVVILDGSAQTPSWATRNTVTGHAQSAATGVHLTSANTNTLNFHPQNCDTGFLLEGTAGSDTNTVDTFCENNTVDWDANAASQNNVLRGSFDASATNPITNFGTNTTLRSRLYTALPAFRSPQEWDGNGANFIRRPKSGQSGTTHYAVWTRDNADVLTRAYYVERGQATPKVQFDAPVNFNGLVNGTTLAVSDLYVAKTADTVRTSTTTLADDAHLTLAVATSSTYIVNLMLIYDASTTGDISFGFTGPAGAALEWSVNGLRLAAATASDTINRARGTLATALDAGGAGVGTKTIALPVGLLTTGGNAGNFVLQWAPKVNEATNCTLYTKSWMTLKKVA